MKKVYKYEVTLNDIIRVNLPENAKILHIDVQKNENHIYIWALIDPEVMTIEMKLIRIAGTGHPIELEEPNLRYINTFTMCDKSLWFHAFEIVKEL